MHGVGWTCVTGFSSVGGPPGRFAGRLPDFFCISFTAGFTGRHGKNS